MDPVHILKAERKWALSPQSQVSPLRYHRCARRPTQSARPTLWWPEQPEKRAGLHYICSFRPSADRRQKAGSLIPHPVQDPLESWYPKRTPLPLRARAAHLTLVSKQVQPPGPHSATAHQHSCQAGISLPCGITPLPPQQRPRAPSGDISFSGLKPGTWITSFQQTHDNSSNLLAAKMYESHEGLYCTESTVLGCAQPLRLWDLTEYFWIWEVIHVHVIFYSSHRGS